MIEAEKVLLLCGVILFLTSLIFMFLQFRREKPILRIIWFLILSFLMMGFSQISKADLGGFFKFERDQKFLKVSILTEALKKCPENESLKEELESSLKEYNTYIQSENEDQDEKDLEQIGEAILLIEQESTDSTFTAQEFILNPSDETVKNIELMVETQHLISSIAEKEDKEKVTIEVEQRIDSLSLDPSISPEQIQILSKHLDTIKERYQISNMHIMGPVYPSFKEYILNGNY